MKKANLPIDDANVTALAAFAEAVHRRHVEHFRYRGFKPSVLGAPAGAAEFPCSICDSKPLRREASLTKGDLHRLPYKRASSLEERCKLSLGTKRVLFFRLAHIAPCTRRTSLSAIAVGRR
jgi:hypothetical protein